MLRKLYRITIFLICIFLSFSNALVVKSSNNLNVYKDAVITSKNVNFRVNSNAKSKIFRNLKYNEKVKIINKYNNWYKIKDVYGTIGYVYYKYVKIVKKTTNAEKNISVIKSTYINPNAKISIVWDPNNIVNIKSSFIYSSAKVISPTWFKLKNSAGNIESVNASEDYVKRQHSLSKKVWVLFSNDFNPELTHNFLKSYKNMNDCIYNLISLSKAYHIDGINVDFENIYVKDKMAYSNFIKLLYKYTKKNKLVLSVDVTAISSSDNWSKCYDRAEIAKNSDYVMLMAYDQHSEGSEAGSIAELSWVKNSVNRVLKEIPNNKLVLGVPFYTRLWIEKKEGNTLKTYSEVMSMQKVTELISSKKLKKIWDKNAGQNYVQYVENGYKYKIWIEDAVSIKLRNQIIKQYNLAGVAAWRGGFEVQEVWNYMLR